MVSKAFNESDYSELRDEINNDLNLPRAEDNGYLMESYLPPVDKADVQETDDEDAEPMYLVYVDSVTENYLTQEDI